MCHCTPGIRKPFCGKPGCEWPEQKDDALEKIVDDRIDEQLDIINGRFKSPIIRLVDGATPEQKLDTLFLLLSLNSNKKYERYKHVVDAEAALDSFDDTPAAKRLADLARNALAA